MKSWYILVATNSVMNEVRKTRAALLVIAPLRTYFAATASVATPNDIFKVIVSFGCVLRNKRSPAFKEKKDRNVEIT
jgi:hypothetical protein